MIDWYFCGGWLTTVAKRQLHDCSNPCSPVEFHHVALAGDPQGPGKDIYAPGDPQVPAAFAVGLVMGVLEEKRAVGGAEIFRLLVFNVDKGPLAEAEFEAMQPGKLKEILLVIRHR